MIYSNSSVHRRLAALEATRRVPQLQIVRTHVLDCAPEEREARIAAIDAAEPGAFHIVRVIVEPATQG